MLQKVSGDEKFYGQVERVRVSRFSFKIFLSHIAEKFCRGILQCFFNFGYRKMLEIRGGNHDFRRNCFVSQDRNIS